LAHDRAIIAPRSGRSTFSLPRSAFGSGTVWSNCTTTPLFG